MKILRCAFSSIHKPFGILLIGAVLLQGCMMKSETYQPSPDRESEVPTIRLSTGIPVTPTQATVLKTVTATSFTHVPAGEGKIKPTDSHPFAKNAIGIIHTDNDPGGTSASDFFLDETGNVIAAFRGPGNYFATGEDPCSLYNVIGVEKGIALIKIDLQGNQKEYRVIDLFPEYRHPFNLYGLTLSPDRMWISYYWPSGDGGEYDPRDAENRNLEMINVQQNTGKPLSITAAGGSTRQGGDWSADGSLFAYTDRDHQGNQQVILMDMRTMEKDQVSQFSQGPTFEINVLKFSPDGGKVAFLGSISHKRDPDDGIEVWHEGIAGVIDLENKKTYFLQLPGQNFDTSDILWWNLAGDQFVTRLEAYRSGDYVAWFDLKTRGVVITYPEMDEKSFSVSAVFPIRDIEKVFVLGKGNILFDRESLSAQEITFPDICCSTFDYHIFEKEIDLNACLSQ